VVFWGFCFVKLIIKNVIKCDKSLSLVQVLIKNIEGCLDFKKIIVFLLLNLASFLNE
jgi:hypothetical protein